MRSRPSVLRSCETCTCRAVAAVSGGLPSQSSSTRRSRGTGSLACKSSSVRSVRCFAPVTLTTRPPSSTSSGPRMRNSNRASPPLTGAFMACRRSFSPYGGCLQTASAFVAQTGSIRVTNRATNLSELARTERTSQRPTEPELLLTTGVCANRTQEVAGSSPASSTSLSRRRRLVLRGLAADLLKDPGVCGLGGDTAGGGDLGGEQLAGAPVDPAVDRPT